MNIFRQARWACVSGLLATLLISTAGADEGAAEPPKRPTSPFSSYLNGYCMKYTQIEKNELNQMIRDLKETGYPVDYYFLTAACEPQKVAEVKSPMIQLTAEDPCYRAEYPQIIYKYYTVKRKEPKIWLEVINAKNTHDETYLDFIETLIQQNEYRSAESKECVNQLISFACKTGGVYSKYPNKTCPAE
jgi:hypothetical protein